ncbi:FAD dependent oxidoreductase [Thermus thermophilus]|nr:FAD dependent oxidoreductase [Thermus thermophilus]
MWVLGALSGYGVMAALGAGNALAAWALGEGVPAWAWAFAPGRFLDPAYRPKEGAARFQL